MGFSVVYTIGSHVWSNVRNNVESRKLNRQPRLANFGAKFKQTYVNLIDHATARAL